jgi:hypothetical protein
VTRNLLRFTLGTSAIVFAFAANLAAMVAQVLYVFLPGTRVSGAAPMHWLSSQAPTSRLDLLTIVCVVGAGAFVLGCMARYKESK